MKRRTFISTASILFGTLAARVLTAPSTALAASQPAGGERPLDPCIPGLDSISAEATGFLRYEHFHRVSIPVAVLIDPPEEGHQLTTTELDQRSLNEGQLKKFLKETGLKEEDIRFHTHTFTVSRAQLEEIASGKPNVPIEIKTPKGNFGHIFYFTASKSALIKIQRARTGRI